jgi:hypothetical protein
LPNKKREEALMSCSDIIQLVLAGITLVGVLVALLQPILRRQADGSEQVKRIKGIVSLYLDVLEIKVQEEMTHLRDRQPSLVKRGLFEQMNQVNYKAIERVLQEAIILNNTDYGQLMAFVRYFKTSKNMRDLKDLKLFLSRIKHSKLRSSFPEGTGLSIEIDIVRQD